MHYIFLGRISFALFLYIFLHHFSRIWKRNTKKIIYIYIDAKVALRFSLGFI